MVCRLFGAKPLPEPMMLVIYSAILMKKQHFSHNNMKLKMFSV